MVTVVNQTPGDTASSSGVNSLLGLALFFIALVLFFYYALPAMRNSFSGPSFSVPEQVDVNVNTPTNPAP
ncbi:MAG TPA: hypothetical protein VD999_01470 [Vitreimonas sp.]|nr:hypothetical protein [Vitreimonas sp.]